MQTLRWARPAIHTNVSGAVIIGIADCQVDYFLEFFPSILADNFFGAILDYYVKKNTYSLPLILVW